MGYVGVLNTNTGKLTSDGVINLVVKEWAQ
jgi:hypothetical protein